MRTATHKFTEKAYINKMLPHLLPIEARKIGITQSNKREWKALAGRIKYELEDRYKNASEKELEKDLSFNEKSISSRPSDFQFLINSEIIRRTPFIPLEKREWVRTARLDLLSKSISGESELAEMLNLVGIRAIQKYPMIISDKIYFAGICLPDYKIVIEITKKDIPVVRAYGTLKDRADDFKRKGYFVEFISTDKAKDENLMNTFINKIRLYAKAQSK